MTGTPLRRMLLVCALATGCQGGGEAPAEAVPPAEERAPTRQDTLRIEGMAQPVELRLVESPAKFPLPFTAYVPPDLAVDGAGRGDQAEVRFVADFGNGPAPAWLEVSAYPAGLSEQDALERARRAGGADGVRVPEGAMSQAWAHAEWRVPVGPGGDGRIGRVLLAQHDERWFHVRILYPPEFGDGFGPRSALVLDTWRWSDGSPLDPRTGS